MRSFCDRCGSPFLADPDIRVVEGDRFSRFYHQKCYERIRDLLSEGKW